MDKLIEKKKEYRAEMRKGREVDMERFLGELDSEYITDLEGSLSSFDDYMSISAETYNDYKVVAGKLYVLRELDYLTEKECDEMVKTAYEMRLKKLEGLEHEESGS